MSDPVARAVLGPLLEQSPRFVRAGEGAWRLDAAPGAQSSPFPGATFAVVDIETTGGRPPQHRITELAAVKVRDGRVTGEYNALVNPGREIPWSVVRLTGITDAMVADHPPLDEVLPGFLDFIEGCVFVAHCANFDFHFVRYFASEFLGREIAPPVLCTFKLAHRFLPHLERYNLGELGAYLGLSDWEDDRHRALGDARATAEILIKFLQLSWLVGLGTLDGLLAFQDPPAAEPPQMAEGVSIAPEALRDLPARRGVFRLLDEKGETVYAAKAADIRRAVRDLFYPRSRSAVRFAQRLRAARAVEARPLESELGMSLEAGRLMRRARTRNGNTAGAGFLRLGRSGGHPRISVAGSFAADGSSYYGPFRKQAHLRDLMEVIHAVFPFRRLARTGAGAGPARAEGEGPPPLPEVSSRLEEKLLARLRALLEGRFNRREEGELLSLLDLAWDGKGPTSSRLRRNLGRLRHLAQSFSLSGPSVEDRNLLIVEPGETRQRRICYFVRSGLLVEEMEFARDAPPAEALGERIREVFFRAGHEPAEAEKEQVEEAAVIAAWLRRELIDGFILDLSMAGGEGDALDVLIKALADPMAAGTVIPV